INANAGQYRRGIVKTWAVAQRATPLLKKHTIELISLSSGTSGVTSLDAFSINIGTSTCTRNASSSAWCTYQNDVGANRIYYMNPTDWLSNANIHYTDNWGSYIRFTFIGDQIKFNYTKGKNRGTAVVSIDEGTSEAH